MGRMRTQRRKGGRLQKAGRGFMDGRRIKERRKKGREGEK